MSQGLQGVQGDQGDRGERGKNGNLPWRIELSFWLVVVVAFVVVSGLSYVIADNRGLARDGKQAHDSLCVFKADLGRRIDESTTYLAENPGPVFGIPRATVEQSVANQRATFLSLSELDCPPPAE